MKGIKYISEIGIQTLNPISIVEEVRGSDILQCHLKTADYFIGKYKTSYIVINSNKPDLEQWKVFSEDEFMQIKFVLSKHYVLQPNVQNLKYQELLSKKDASLLNNVKRLVRGFNAKNYSNLAYPVSSCFPESRSNYEKIKDLFEIYTLVDIMVTDLEILINARKEQEVNWYLLFKRYLIEFGYLKSSLFKGYLFDVSKLENGFVPTVPELDLNYLLEIKAKLVFGTRTIGFILTNDLKLQVAYCILSKEKANNPKMKSLAFIQKLDQGLYLP